MEQVKEEVHKLGRELSELRPLVREVHSNMPRIARALETLARVTEQQESNSKDHKRLHYRITEARDYTRVVEAHHDELERQFKELRDEHIVCTTTGKLRRDMARKGLWGRIKMKVQERLVEWTVVLVFGLLVWLLLMHTGDYSAVAKLLWVLRGEM